MTREKVADICDRIRQLKRRRDAVIKSRIRIENGLASNAATIIGYHSGMDEKERKEHWTKQKTLIMSILSKEKKGKAEKVVADVEGDALIIITMLVSNVAPSIVGLDIQNKAYAKRITQLVRDLPIWSWVKENVRGVAEIALGNILGETGDLANYDNPAKVWKRMGCAPFEKDGETHTGKGWKSKGKGSLTKEEWLEFGYNPKRRSVIYNLAAGIVMQCAGKNVDKPGADNSYYLRILEAREVAKEKHPDWTDGHLHSHALLLGGKRFLRDLWIIWNDHTIEK